MPGMSLPCYHHHPGPDADTSCLDYGNYLLPGFLTSPASHPFGKSLPDEFSQNTVLCCSLHWFLAACRITIQTSLALETLCSPASAFVYMSLISPLRWLTHCPLTLPLLTTVAHEGPLTWPFPQVQIPCVHVRVLQAQRQLPPLRYNILRPAHRSAPSPPLNSLA